MEAQPHVGLFSSDALGDRLIVDVEHGEPARGVEVEARQEGLGLVEHEVTGEQGRGDPPRLRCGARGSEEHGLGGELTGDVHLSSPDGVVVDDIIVDDQADVQQLHRAGGVRRGLRCRASQALMGIDEQAGPDHLSAQRHPRQRFPELFVLLGADSRASPSSGEDFDEAGFDGQDALQFL